MAEGEEASRVRGSEIRETRRTRRRALGEAEAGGAACAVLSSRPAARLRSAPADEETNASCHPRDAGKSSSRSRFPFVFRLCAQEATTKAIFMLGVHLCHHLLLPFLPPSHFLNPRPPGCPPLSLIPPIFHAGPAISLVMPAPFAFSL